MVAIDGRPLFVSRKVFLKRLARRLAASVVAMAALHFLSQNERGETPMPMPSVSTPATSSDIASATPDGDAAAGNVAENVSLRSDADTKEGNGRTDRLRREESPAPITRSFEIAKAAEKTTETADVMMFDRCLPDCDSRDPLLLGRGTLAAGEAAAAEEPMPFDEAVAVSSDTHDSASPAGRRSSPVRDTYSDIRALAGRGIAMVASGAGLLKSN